MPVKGRRGADGRALRGMAQAGRPAVPEELPAGLADAVTALPTLAAIWMSARIQSPVKESSSSDDDVELGGPQPGGVQRREVPDVGAIAVRPGAWPRAMSGRSSRTRNRRDRRSCRTTQAREAALARYEPNSRTREHLLDDTIQHDDSGSLRRQPSRSTKHAAKPAGSGTRPGRQRTAQPSDSSQDRHLHDLAPPLVTENSRMAQLNWQGTWALIAEWFRTP